MLTKALAAPKLRLLREMACTVDCLKASKRSKDAARYVKDHPEFELEDEEFESQIGSEDSDFEYEDRDLVVNDFPFLVNKMITSTGDDDVNWNYADNEEELDSDEERIVK